MTLTLYVDTETTGLTQPALPPDHPAQPHLVQLGCLLTEDATGRDLAAVELVVRPSGYVVPEQAARVHGVTTELAEACGVPLQVAVAAFTNLRARAEALVAYNLDFDDLVLRAAIARTGRQPAHPGPDRRDCCMRMATDVVCLPPTDNMRRCGFETKHKPPKLIEAYRFLFGEDFEGAHGALADARACQRVHRELLSRRRAEIDQRMPFSI